MDIAMRGYSFARVFFAYRVSFWLCSHLLASEKKHSFTAVFFVVIGLPVMTKPSSTCSGMSFRARSDECLAAEIRYTRSFNSFDTDLNDVSVCKDFKRDRELIDIITSKATMISQ